MERPRGTAPARQSAEAWHFEGRRSQKRDFWRPAGWSRRTERRARPALRSPATAPALFGAQPQYLIWVDSSFGWWAAVTAECRVVSPPAPAHTHTRPCCPLWRVCPLPLAAFPQACALHGPAASPRKWQPQSGAGAAFFLQQRFPARWPPRARQLPSVCGGIQEAREVGAPRKGRASGKAETPWEGGRGENERRQEGRGHRKG